MPVVVDRMTVADLDEVLAIESASFASPWSRASFLYELLENQRAVYLVAKEDERVVGYIGMWVIFDEGHITNLAVHPDFRRRGIGALLLSELIAEAKTRGVSHLTLEVRQSNLGAQLLYAKHGFVTRGVRRRYYRDNDEDALIMWKSPL
ncbi:MAG: ribosomal protein S18-alanine N-acetyltransferase [Firmicutes bacterium]|nr:ribosomal protein S18-alanine N-acetyltransferase [Bacillota bacterium]